LSGLKQSGNNQKEKGFLKGNCRIPKLMYSRFINRTHYISKPDWRGKNTSIPEALSIVEKWKMGYLT
jgi:hypothetical protein